MPLQTAFLLSTEPESPAHCAIPTAGRHLFARLCTEFVDKCGARSGRVRRLLTGALFIDTRKGMRAYRIAVVVGSLRKNSYNAQLARVAAAMAQPQLEFQQVRIDDLPLYNQD